MLVMIYSENTYIPYKKMMQFNNTYFYPKLNNKYAGSDFVYAIL